MPAQMTEEKHTAGPWERRGPTQVYGNLQRDQNSTGDLVARTVKPSDARLIASAPDLLTSLRHVTNALESLQGGEWQTIKDARAAISRATGAA